MDRNEIAAARAHIDQIWKMFEQSDDELECAFRQTTAVAEYMAAKGESCIDRLMELERVKMYCVMLVYKERACRKAEAALDEQELGDG